MKGRKIKNKDDLIDFLVECRNDPVYIWVHRREEHELRQKLFDTKSSWDEWRTILVTEVAKLEQQGVVVHTVEIPVQTMFEELQKQNLDPINGFSWIARQWFLKSST